MPQLDLGKVVGDTGPQGPKGDQGIQGPAGQTGPGVAVGGSANQVLVKHSGTNYDTQWVDAGNLPSIAGVQDAVAIVANGDTHPAIADGQFVYVRNHSTLAEGLYKATAAIGTDVALTTSNLTADSGGGLNDLQAQVSSLNSKFQTRVGSLNDFISIFDDVQQPRLVFIMSNATNVLTGGRTNGNAVVVGYKTYDSSYIIYYGQTSQPHFFSGYVDLSNNNITVHEMYSMRRVRCNFDGITITAGGYKKLCGYSAISNGIGADNIVSVKVQAGMFSGTQMVEVYQDGLYLYSSSAYTNKNIVLDIIYTPYATILYDADKTITVT